MINAETAKGFEVVRFLRDDGLPISPQSQPRGWQPGQRIVRPSDTKVLKGQNQNAREIVDDVVNTSLAQSVLFGVEKVGVVDWDVVDSHGNDRRIHVVTVTADEPTEDMIREEAELVYREVGVNPEYMSLVSQFVLAQSGDASEINDYADRVREQDNRVLEFGPASVVDVSVSKSTLVY